MTRKQTTALAEHIARHNNVCDYYEKECFTLAHIGALADFCKSQNRNFNREKFLTAAYKGYKDR